MQISLNTYNIGKFQRPEILKDQIYGVCKSESEEMWLQRKKTMKQKIYCFVCAHSYIHPNPTS